MNRFRPGLMKWADPPRETPGDAALAVRLPGQAARARGEVVALPSPQRLIEMTFDPFSDLG